MRPVNGIVDVTNYVMLEMGQPLHAFDFHTLRGGRIVVRRARPGETLTTLDGVDRVLSPDMLMICDAERPVAVAGVMGGAETEISESTSVMLLESAHFHPLSVRRTARALAMSTEASRRFERVVDPNLVAAAADRACRLIADLGLGQVVDGIVDVYPKPLPPRVLRLRPERVSLLLGYSVGQAEASEALGRLGFRAVPDDGALSATVPSWRPDIAGEADLAEEVGRVLGYERIPERLPFGASTQGGDSLLGRFVARVAAGLAGAGLQEVVCHSLLAPSPFDDETGERIAIRSALSADLSGLRRSLLPGLLEALDRNARRGQSPLGLFEVGRVFHRTGGSFRESLSIGGALAGPLARPSWLRGAWHEPADYYTARGILELLAESLGAREMDFAPGSDPRLHPGRSAFVLLGGRQAGVAGELHPRLAQGLHARHRIVVFELDAEALQAACTARTRYAPLSPYPAVVRDLAPRLSRQMPFARVREAVEAAAVPVLERHELTDLFEGPPLPEGTRSLTLSFTFRAPDRTLTEEEVAAAVAALRESLEARCGASFPA